MSAQTRHHVIVVGTASPDWGMAIRLRQQGMIDFVVLERVADVDGTGRDSNYPGRARDVPAPLYSFSFELKPFWSRSFSGQQEIWDYLRHCTGQLRRRWRFAQPRPAPRWRAHLADRRAVESVHSGRSGLDSFQGRVFHPARWDLDYDLRAVHLVEPTTGLGHT